MVFAQARLHGCDAGGHDGFYEGVLAEEPEGEVDVVDGAVDEDAAGELGVGYEEAARVEFVACLAPEDGWAPDEPGVHFVPGVSVGGVEAAGEAAHDFQVRFLLCGIDH